jgi:hypothetical protein
MDIKQIQDLIRFVSKSGVNEVAIEQKDFKITIKTTGEQTVNTMQLYLCLRPLRLRKLLLLPRPLHLLPLLRPLPTPQTTSLSNRQ